MVTSFERTRTPATRRCRCHDQYPGARPDRGSSPHSAERSAPAHRLPALAAGRGPLDGPRPPGQERRLDGQDDQGLRHPGGALDHQCSLRPGRAHPPRTRRTADRRQAARPDHHQLLGGHRIPPGRPRDRQTQAHPLRSLDRNLHGLHRARRAAGRVRGLPRCRRDWRHLARGSPGGPRPRAPSRRAADQLGLARGRVAARLGPRGQRPSGHRDRPHRPSAQGGIAPMAAAARSAATPSVTAEEKVVSFMSDATSINSTRDRRWLILGVIGIAQLMVILDLTVMNIALPSAQRALHFTTADRQWAVTAYTLAFGSLLLLGGRLADLLGRKVTFLTGLAGFAGVSAIGGASVNFAMLITARACQGAFAALLVPSALSLLTTTFAEPKDRGKAFGIYGAIAGAGGAIGLLLGGALTEYLS